MFPKLLNGKCRLNIALLLSAFMLSHAGALERAGVEFRIFQFPREMIPRIDGNTADWNIVPDGYVIGTDELSETVRGQGTNIDVNDIDIRVRVGWVKGLNRLYFLYEAYDNYWDFSSSDLHNDIFEVVVDGDLSGGPFIKSMNPNKALLSPEELYFSFHGVHAQNHHILTPPGHKNWDMVWGCCQWIKDFPYAHNAYSYDFKHGKAGKLILEFWITPFDYAPAAGPKRAVVSRLEENKIIGLSWVVLDYDGPGNYKGFYTLSHKTQMYGNASDLCAFRLMPLEKRFVKKLAAYWTYTVVDMDRRLVAFKDLSNGNITKWKWEFGDGTTSSKQHPTHRYNTPGEKTVTLHIEGPDGKKRFTRVRDVFLK